MIYNPAAGSRSLEARRGPALEILREQAETVDALPTEGPGSATALARKACARGADLVLALGGDGTVNEVINGLAHTPVPLAVLPAGTANVLARELEIPLDPVRAAAMLPGLEPRRIALGRLSTAAASRYFLLMCGAGLDARIVYTLNLRLKSYVGILSYWMAGLRQIGRRWETFDAEIDSQRQPCTFVLAARASRYGGGLRIARRAHLLAEEMDVVLIETRSSLRYLLYLAGAATGSLDRFSGVSLRRSRRVRMEGPASVHLQVDGEYAGRLPATVETAPDALTLLMPAGYIRSHG